MRAVIARQQHLGHRRAAKHLGPRVLRVLEQPPRERIARGRVLVAQHAGQQPRHRVGHHQRGQLAAGQHVVADGQLLVHELLAHPLVHALVAAADEHQVRSRAPARARPPGVKRRPAGIQQDHARRPSGARSASMAAASGSGFRIMPPPPPKGGSSVTRCRPGGVVPEVVHADVHEAARAARPRIDSRERRLEHPREQRDDVDPHRVQQPLRRIDHDAAIRHAHVHHDLRHRGDEPLRGRRRRTTHSSCAAELDPARTGHRAPVARLDHARPRAATGRSCRPAAAGPPPGSPRAAGPQSRRAASGESTPVQPDVARCRRRTGTTRCGTARAGPPARLPQRCTP